jgi:16S rRNA (cytidine1402-2'-O)-methyltransferase
VTEPRPLAAGLYLVASPIGNLGDVTLRALEVLAAADLVACEDTRITARLLARHGIAARTVSCHAHNERRQIPRLLAALTAGRRVALISDAGTPGISDPGLLLVQAARAAGVPVYPLPGPSAVIAALAASGLPDQPFTFLGFLPPRAGARRRALEQVATLPHTLVLFEAPHRLAAALADLALVLGPRQAALCRELTKVYEEIRVAPLDALAATAGGSRTRGEITIVVAPPPADAATTRAGAKAADLPPLTDDYRTALAESGGNRKAALRLLARRRHVSRNTLNRELLAAGIGGDDA